jgi:hypothetical protein
MILKSEKKPINQKEETRRLEGELEPQKRGFGGTQTDSTHYPLPSTPYDIHSPNLSRPFKCLL